MHTCVCVCVCVCTCMPACMCVEGIDQDPGTTKEVGFRGWGHLEPDLGTRVWGGQHEA